MKSLLVFCGSASGNNADYTALAYDFGAVLARMNIAIIYGGAQVGMMGALATGALENGGTVIGIIPEFLQTKEVAHKGLSQLITVASMHERKLKMYELCDAALVMPGGYGTMDEMFEFLTWAQLGLHQKPLGIWNINGYYDHLIAQINTMIQAGFIQVPYGQLFVTSDNIDSVLEGMRHYKAPEGPQWIQSGQQ